MHLHALCSRKTGTGGHVAFRQDLRSRRRQGTGTNPTRTPTPTPTPLPPNLADRLISRTFLAQTMNSADRLSFKNLYLRRLLRALRSLDARAPPGDSNLGDRRRAIKLAADVSLALTARRAAWSRHALVSNLVSQKTKYLVERIAGRRKVHSILAEFARNRPPLRAGRFKRRIQNSGRLDDDPLKRRTKELRRLIPGGESIRRSCLLGETADYILSLKAQVEVMQSLANSLQLRRSA